MSDYEASINKLPKYLQMLQLFPSINLIVKENMCSFYYNEGRHISHLIGTSNISLDSVLINITKFLKVFESKYKTLSYIIDDKIDPEKTSKICEFFNNYYKHQNETTIINFFINIHKLIEEIKFGETNISLKEEIVENDFKISFNNFDHFIYISRLKDLVDTKLYEKAKAKKKEIKSSHQLNEIILILQLFFEALVTLLNYNLFSNLVLFEMKGNKIKTMNLIGEIFDNPLMKREIDKFTGKFKIPIINKFDQSECEFLAMAFNGLEYFSEKGPDEISDKFAVYKTGKKKQSLMNISEIYNF